MFRVLSSLIDRGILNRDDKFLVLGCGAFDEAVVAALGLSNVTTTNIEVTQMTPGTAVLQDARVINYADGEFDCVVTHATLHHVDRPHQAVCEMYRVARKVAVFFEAQDSMLMRCAAKAGLVVNYERNAIHDSGGRRGGVNDSPVPNYVYRWTRREVEKLVRTLDPAREPVFEIRTEWDFSWRRIARRLQSSPLRFLGQSFLAFAAKAGMAAANLVAGRQGNLFAACIIKDQAKLQPWMVVNAQGKLEYRWAMEARQQAQGEKAQS